MEPLQKQRIFWGAMGAFVGGPLVFVLARRGCNSETALLMQMIVVAWIILELYFLLNNV